MTEVGPIDVSLSAPRAARAVSRWCFGTNHGLPGVARWPLIRAGGNRFTGYNFENDASNGGRDANHQADHWLTYRWTGDHPPFVIEDTAGLPDPGEPMAALRWVQRAAVEQDAAVVWTLPMAGYVAADAAGPVTEAQAAPSGRWVEPDAVAMIQAIRAMDEAVGRDAAYRVYSLDNEPGLWAQTHPRLHGEKATVEEVIRRSIDEARHVKQLDPGARVIGPALWGMAAFVHLQDAPDALSNEARRAGPFRWFIDQYLDAFRIASEEEGVRLLDVLDLHW